MRNGFQTARRSSLARIRFEVVIDLKDMRRYAIPWAGLAPDDSALFVRAVRSDEIYSLEGELP
jgi:hypothetical protein